MKLKIVRKKTDNDGLHFTLSGEMTIYSVSKLKTVMLKELNSCSKMTMDLAEVDEADTSGFQLLLFLKREARLLGKSFRITEASGRLKSIFTLYKETL
jgi:anti-anti-sigma factor